MGRDQVAPPDELVQLDHVHVAGLARFGSVNDHEQVVGVGVDLGNMPPFEDVAHRERMEAEHVGEVLGRFLVAGRHVDPNEAVGSSQQPRKLRALAFLKACTGYPTDAQGPIGGGRRGL